EAVVGEGMQRMKRPPELSAEFGIDEARFVSELDVDSCVPWHTVEPPVFRMKQRSECPLIRRGSHQADDAKGRDLAAVAGRIDASRREGGTEQDERDDRRCQRGPSTAAYSPGQV